MDIGITKTVNRIKSFIYYANEMGLRIRHLVFPALLAVSASFFEGITFLLLIPTIRGLFLGDYTYIKELAKKKIPIMQWDSLLLGNPKIFLILIGLIFVSIIFKNILMYYSTLSVTRTARNLANVLRKKIYQRFLSFGKGFFDRNNSGHLHQVLLGYTSRVSQELILLNKTLNVFFNLIIYLTIMFCIAPQISAFTMLAFPVLYVLLQSFVKKIRRDSEEYTKQYNELSKKISNTLQCIPLVKAYSNESKEEQWFKYSSDRVNMNEISIDKNRAIIDPLQEIIMFTGLLALISFIAFIMVPGKQGDMMHFLVFFLVLRRAMNTFGVFNNVFISLASISGPIRQIKEIFSDKDKYFIKDGTRIFTGQQKDMVFDNVHFRYSTTEESTKNTLEGINLTIRKGEMVAIVGSSGAGKSTLISMAMRFYDPTQGQILLDGVDIREYTLESFHEHVSLVSQDVYVFNAPFKVNLSYGLKKEPTTEEMFQVLEQTRLSDLVRSWSEGLDTPIGDRGVNLSGGEKQRLSIARALLRKTEILILDEATSALDSTTEKLIQNNLKELVKGKTSIVIAHRLSTIRHADHIIVLEKGKIIEQGKAEQLLEKKGKFFEHWSQQHFF